MKAPDKIYLSGIIMAGIKSLDKPVSDSDVEYIRKDALLEWLEESKKEMEKELDGSNETIRFATAIAISSFQEVIDKLNSFLTLID